MFALETLKNIETLQAMVKPHMYTPPKCIPHSNVLVNWFFRARTGAEGEPVIYSVYRFRWYKHSHHSRFQAPNKTALNMEEMCSLGSDKLVSSASFTSITAAVIQGSPFHSQVQFCCHDYNSLTLL